ncbi:MAG: cytochrome c oxidase assembly factor 1 family protein [Planctomycetes bacterium]|nr:cytochrome c oxidase assembly factor 1 family protein [Planctomycetota bacterium]
MSSAPPTNPHEPPPRRRSWPKALALGCLGLAACGVLLVALLVELLVGALKSSEAYNASLAAVRASDEIREDFGEPLSPAWWVTGSVQIENADADAELEYRISGPKAQGKVAVRGAKRCGAWAYEVLIVVRDDGKTYDLLAKPPDEAFAPKPAGASLDDGSPPPAPEVLIAQPAPEFLNAGAAGAAPPAVLHSPVSKLRLAPAVADAVQAEQAFADALLKGDWEKAQGGTSAAFLKDDGAAMLQAYAALATDRGGGTFTPWKWTRLEDGATAVLGAVAFGDGTKAKLMVLSRDGKVEAFNGLPAGESHEAKATHR